MSESKSESRVLDVFGPNLVIEANFSSVLSII